jgi:hypothetical protein
MYEDINLYKKDLDGMTLIGLFVTDIIEPLHFILSTTVDKDTM